MLSAAFLLGGFFYTAKGTEAMIANPSLLAGVQAEGQGVVRMREQMRHQLNDLIVTTQVKDVSWGI
jgi:hypothetical protein